MGSKTDVAVKLALVFFISLLSFSVGTFVGKKYSDNQHQLAALEPQSTAKPYIEREVANVENDTVTTQKEETEAVMTDDELAKLAAEFATEDGDSLATSTAPTGTNAQPSEIAEKLSSATVNSEETVSVPQVTGTAKTQNAPTNTATPTPKNKVEERLPSSLPKDVANFSAGKFTVQIASYADEAEAKGKAAELKGLGYAAFYIPATIKGKTWYRVSVGQFATQKEAQTYRAKLLSGAKVNSAIVQKITE